MPKDNLERPEAIMVPTVHANGSGRDTLMSQVKAAHDAASALREALSAMAPHGRDYYPQGDGVIFQALKQHRARCDVIEAFKGQLAELYVAIDAAAGGERRAS